MKRKSRNILLTVICCVLVSTALLTIVGKWTGGNFDVIQKIQGERNEDNLITVAMYQSSIEDKNLINGLKMSVDDDGVIKINGTASEDYEETVCTVTLEAGTYTIGGYKSSIGKAGLKAVVNGAPHYAGITNNVNGETFTLEEASSVSIVIFVKEDAQFIISTTFRPTLADGSETIEFYK